MIVAAIEQAPLAESGCGVKVATAMVRAWLEALGSSCGFISLPGAAIAS